jgi:hypothetical protein
VIKLALLCARCNRRMTRYDLVNQTFGGKRLVYEIRLDTSVTIFGNFRIYSCSTVKNEKERESSVERAYSY